MVAQSRPPAEPRRSWFKTKNTLHANYLCMIDQGRRPGTSFAGADAAPVTVDMAAEGLKGNAVQHFYSEKLGFRSN